MAHIRLQFECNDRTYVLPRCFEAQLVALDGDMRAWSCSPNRDGIEWVVVTKDSLTVEAQASLQVA
jgi:hypothetical protein